GRTGSPATCPSIAIGGGIVGALLAAMPGFIDYLSITDTRARKVGFVHMIANLTAVGVFAVSFWLRWSGTVGFLPAGVSLAGLVALARWLAGELVFVHGMWVRPAGSAHRPGAERCVA